MNLQSFTKAKERGKPLAILTAYDAPTAELLEKAHVDAILVGDSVGMVLLGYASTVPVTMDEMVHHLKAVRRGAKKSFVIGDLPLKGVEKGPRQALSSAKRFVEEAAANAVKLEWRGAKTLEAVELLLKAKIPVMGHVGLTPQTVLKKEGFGMRGKEALAAVQILKQALLLEKKGVFSVLVECVPDEVTRAITERLKIPSIGIGAGPFCDGQVLVFNDLVGLFTKFKPHFVKRYAHLYDEMEKAVSDYLKDVRSGRFPRKENGFKMNQEELKNFVDLLDSVNFFYPHLTSPLVRGRNGGGK